MIVFRNPNEIDIRAATHIGINSKPGSTNPIGFFGTGLKNAIAVLLREGQKIEIWSGVDCYKFILKDITFREKVFKAVCLVAPDGKVTELSYTTELGKNWNLRHAYRELWSNCKDEGGDVSEEREIESRFMPADSAAAGVQGPLGVNSAPGQTTINVIGEAFAKAHDERFGTILLPENLKLVFSSPRADVYSGASNHVYLRGISVLEMKEPTAFTYNLKSSYIGLTEDRTLVGGDYHLRDFIQDSLCDGFDESTIETVICAGKQFYEGNHIDLQYRVSASDAFCAATSRAMKTRPQMVSAVASNLLFRVRGAKAAIEYVQVTLNAHESQTLSDALNTIKTWGVNYSNIDLIVVETLGGQVLAQALIPAKQVILTKKILGDFDLLLGTLVEEWVHITYSVGDNTRAMQEALLAIIVRLGKSVTAFLGDVDATDDPKGEVSDIEEKYLAGNTKIPQTPIDDDDICF